MFPSQSIDQFGQKRNLKKNKSFKQNDFCPRRFALNYRPPMLILEYLIPSKKKLYHKRIRIKEFKENTNIEKVSKKIMQRYQNYLPKNKISISQIQKLLNKLKIGFLENKSKINQKTKNNSFVKQNSQNSFRKQDLFNKKENNTNKVIKEDFLMNNSLRDSKQQKKSFLKKNQEIKIEQIKNTQLSNDFSEDFDEFSQNQQSQLQQSKLLQQNNNSLLNSKKDENLMQDNDDESLEEILDDFDEISDDDSFENEEKKSQENSQIQQQNDSINITNIDIENENLNKLDDKQIEKLKEKMDQDYNQNKINIQDSQFVYDQREDFNPDESNDWDNEFSELDEF